MISLIFVSSNIHTIKYDTTLYYAMLSLREKSAGKDRMAVDFVS